MVFVLLLLIQARKDDNVYDESLVLLFTVKHLPSSQLNTSAAECSVSFIKSSSPVNNYICSGDTSYQPMQKSSQPIVTQFKFSPLALACGASVAFG